jgi:enoyl-CoA hydratase
MIMNELLVERRGSMLELTLNRPEKMNALSGPLVDALLGHLSSAADSGVRLLVLKGAGRNFSAGFDFGDYESESEGDLILRFIRIEQLLQAVYHAPFETLALAHGKNFGAGVDLICSCSHRVADPNASFQMPGLSFGVVLGTRRFAERVGNSHARHILQRGLSFPADQGLVVQFLTGVVEKNEWSKILHEIEGAVGHLSLDANARLNSATAVCTRARDLSDLVESLALPGLKERIRRYRSQLSSIHRATTVSGQFENLSFGCASLMLVSLDHPKPT